MAPARSHNGNEPGRRIPTIISSTVGFVPLTLTNDARRQFRALFAEQRATALPR